MWEIQRQRLTKTETEREGGRDREQPHCHNLPRVNNSKDNITRNMFLPGDVQRIFPQHSSENHNSPLGEPGWRELGHRTVPTADGRFLPALQTAKATHTHWLASLPGTRLPGHPSPHGCPTPPSTPGFVLRLSKTLTPEQDVSTVLSSRPPAPNPSASSFKNAY